jgi:dihydroorotate dehydrogenase (NAD+) catalytic subunit
MIDLAPNNAYGLNLATPLVVAGGCLGYGSEIARTLGFGAAQANHGFGALITRTTTLQPQRARPLPQVSERPAGIIYHGVEHNPGLRGVLGRHGTAWASWNLPVILSIGGATINEVSEIAGSLEGVEGIGGIEIPLAYCGISTPAETTRLVSAVRAATLLPLLIKLPGQAHELVALAQAAATAGADALCLYSGIPTLEPTLDGSTREGLLCGPAIFPLTLTTLLQVRPAVTLPIIAGGGVRNAADAQALLDGGAQAVALGSVLLNDPWVAGRMAM